MKKVLPLLLTLSVVSFSARAQLMVSKLISKGDAKYGLGYGLFTYLDIPLRNENQSFRVELLDIAMYPTKGENFFTSTADAKGYISVKLGYKYVFSETQAGFYLIPSAGYARVIFMEEGQDAVYGNGVAAALETGYTFAIGEKGHTLNFGFKYEYDRGSSQYQIQSIGCKVSYGFGLFRQKED